MGEIRATYHAGAQDGFKSGYDRALFDVIHMIQEEFPDSNPLGSIFKPYLGDEIVNRIVEMRG